MGHGEKCPKVSKYILFGKTSKYLLTQENVLDTYEKLTEAVVKSINKQADDPVHCKEEKY